MPDECSKIKTSIDTARGPKGNGTTSNTTAESTRRWWFGFMNKRSSPPREPSHRQTQAEVIALQNSKATTNHPFRPRHARRDALLSVYPVHPWRSHTLSASSAQTPRISGSGTERSPLPRPWTSTVVENSKTKTSTLPSFENRTAMRRSISTPNLADGGGRANLRLRAVPSMASIREVDDDQGVEKGSEDAGNTGIARHLLVVKERERDQRTNTALSSSSATARNLSPPLQSSPTSLTDAPMHKSDSAFPSSSSSVGTISSQTKSFPQLPPPTRQKRTRRPLYGPSGPSCLRPPYFSHESVPDLRARSRTSAGVHTITPAEREILPRREVKHNGKERENGIAVNDQSTSTADIRADTTASDLDETHGAVVGSKTLDPRRVDVAEEESGSSSASISSSESQAEDIVVAANALLEDTRRFLHSQSLPSSSRNLTPSTPSSSDRSRPSPSSTLSTDKTSNKGIVTGDRNQTSTHHGLNPDPDQMSVTDDEQEERRKSSATSSLRTFASSSAFSDSSNWSKDTSLRSTLNIGSSGSGVAEASTNETSETGRSVSDGVTTSDANASTVGVLKVVDPLAKEDGVEVRRQES